MVTKINPQKDLVVVVAILLMIVGISAVFSRNSVAITGAAVGIQEIPIAEQVLADLEQQGIADVIVVLKDTPQTLSKDADIRQDAIAEQQQQVLDDLTLKQTKNLFGTTEREFALDEQFTMVNAFAGEVSASGLEELQSHPNVEEIIPNGVKNIFLADSVPLIQASVAWNISSQAQTIDGTGQTVCLVDTGVDYTHDSLGNCDASSFLAGTCSKVIAGYDFAYDDNDPMDDYGNGVQVYGHGTHVAGIIASTNPTYRGVAPGARIAAVKACTSTGSCADADVLAGIDWCVQHAAEFNITVISMSLGGGQYSAYCDNSSVEAPLYAASINQAVARNISVVVATGNTGSVYSNATAGIALPACIKNAIRVSASTKSDQIAGYAFWNVNFPDTLFAPGSSITSLRPGDATITYFGTSMAAPHVAGAIALLEQFSLLQNNSLITPEQVKQLLIATGTSIDDSVGTGLSLPRINPYHALINVDTVLPIIQFADPTPAGSSSSSGAIIINITSSKLLREAVLEWNAINETIGVNNIFFSMEKTALQNGGYTFTAYGTDYSNRTGKTEFRTILVNNAPAIEIFNPRNNSYHNTAFALNISITSTPNLSVAMVVVVNAAGEIVVNNTLTVTGTAAQVNDLLNISSSIFPDGNYTLLITAADSNGQASTSTSTFVVDKTPPAITGLGKSPELVYNNDSVLFTVNVTDNLLNTALIFLETNASGNWTSYPMGSQGGNKFTYILSGRENLSVAKQIGYRISAGDVVGNQIVSEISIFTVENRWPAITIITPPRNSVIEIGTPLVFTAIGTDEDQESLSYSWDFDSGDLAFGPNQTYTYTQTGLFSATVTAADTVSQSSASVVVTVNDTTPPQFSVVYDSIAHLERDGNVAISATATDFSGIATLELMYNNSVQVGSCSSTTTTKTCSWIVDDLIIGDSAFTITSTDILSHSNSTSYSITVNSCSDNAQNGDEQGVDCGGACSTVCADSPSAGDSSSADSASSDSSSSGEIENSNPEQEVILEETTSEEILSDTTTPVTTEGSEEITLDETISEPSALAAEAINETEVLSFGDSITGFFSALIPTSAGNRSYVLAGLVLFAIAFGSIYFIVGKKKDEVDI